MQATLPAMSENKNELIAYQHVKEKKYMKALEYYQRALEDCLQKPEPESAQRDEDVAKRYISVADMQLATGKFAEAKTNYLNALRIRERLYGNSQNRQGKIAQVYIDIGLVFKKLAKYQFSIQSINHAITILEIMYITEPYHPDICLAKCVMADISQDVCKFDKAVDLLKFAYDGFTQLCGTDNHPLMCEVLETMATINADVSQYNKSISLLHSALALAQKKQTQDYVVDPDVSKLMVSIASVYLKQGKYRDADQYIKDALTKDVEIFGEDNIIYNKVYTYHTFGEIKQAFGEYAVALKSYQTALGILKETFGENGQHPEIARVLDSIALVYQNLAQYPLAHEYHKKASDLRNIIYNTEDINGVHPDVADGLDAKASTYYQQCMYSKALALYSESLSIRETVYGEGVHFSIATSYRNLAATHMKMSNFSQAYESLNKCLVILKDKVFHRFPNHSVIAETLLELSECVSAKGEYETALDYCRQAQNIYTNESLGMSNHPNYAKSFASMGSVYQGQGKLLKAAEYHTKAFKAYKKSYNGSHREIGKSLLKVAFCKVELGKTGAAMVSCMEALEYLNSAGEHMKSHPDLALAFKMIALVSLKRGEHMQATEYLAKALAIYKDVYFTEGQGSHHETASCYDLLGQVYMCNGDIQSAERYILQACSTRKELAPNQCSQLDVADSYLSKGILNFEKRKYTEAIEEYRESLKIQIEVTGNERSLAAAKLHEFIGNVYNELHSTNQALDSYKLALKVREDAYGEGAENLEIANLLYNVGCMLIKLGEFSEAYNRLTKALMLLKKFLEVGSKSSLLASTYYHIAIIGHSVEGTDETAVLKYYYKASELYLDLSKTHPQLSCIFENIGLIKFTQCSYTEALKLHMESLKQKKLNCSDETANISIAKIYDNIGTTQNRLGLYKEAFEHYSKSMNIKKQVYGEEAVCADIAKSNYYLGNALERLGAANDSRMHHINALTMYRIIHEKSPNHPDLARSNYSIGIALAASEDFDQAKEFFTESLKQIKAYYGDNLKSDSSVKGWLDIFNCYMGLGVMHYKQEEYESAADWLNDALQVIEVNYGIHPDYGLVKYLLGKVNTAQQNFQKAVNLFYAAIEVLTKFYVDHPYIANCFHGIGEVCEIQTKYYEAIDHYQTSFEMNKRLGDNHHNTLLFCDSMASIHRKLHEYSKCADYLFQALCIRREIYGSGIHEEIADNLEDIGNIYLIQNNKKQADHFLARAKKMNEHLKKLQR